MSHGRVHYRRHLYLIGVYLTGVDLIGVYLIVVYLMGMYLINVYLTGVHLTGVHLMGVYLIYESSLRAGHGWRESLYRHQRCLEASDCGRLDHQAADHPWSVLRVVKSCRKDCPTAKMLLGAKAAAPHSERYQDRSNRPQDHLCSARLCCGLVC